MLVFTHKVINQLESAVRNIAGTFFEHTKLVLSPEEYISAFIDKDHLDMLRQVQSLFGGPLTVGSMITNVASSSGDSVTMRYAFSGGMHPITVPPYAKHGLQSSCPVDLAVRIRSWVDERIRIGQVFGDAIDALNYLNFACGDLGAMRLVFPAIIPIMGNVSTDSEDKTVKRARQISESTKVGRLPKLTPLQRDRLSEVSAMVNMAVLSKNATIKQYKSMTAIMFAESFNRKPSENVFTRGVMSQIL
jgi:hypothetical protein